MDAVDVDAPRAREGGCWYREVDIEREEEGRKADQAWQWKRMHRCLLKLQPALFRGGER